MEKESGQKMQYVFREKWSKFTKNRYVRDDGCEVNRDNIDGKAAWFAMVPNYFNNKRIGWVGLVDKKLADKKLLTLFYSYQEAIAAVDKYLKENHDE